MAKNLFKTQNIVDTAINVGIGGAANVAVDYVINSLEMETPIEPDTLNLGKFIIGVVGSSMVSNKMVKAAMDGVATVGISNYVSKLISESDSKAAAGGATAGVPYGTVGARPRYVPARKALAHNMRRQNISGSPVDMVE